MKSILACHQIFFDIKNRLQQRYFSLYSTTIPCDNPTMSSWSPLPFCHLWLLVFTVNLSINSDDLQYYYSKVEDSFLWLCGGGVVEVLHMLNGSSNIFSGWLTKGESFYWPLIKKATFFPFFLSFCLSLFYTFRALKGERQDRKPMACNVIKEHLLDGLLHVFILYYFILTSFDTAHWMISFIN